MPKKVFWPAAMVVMGCIFLASNLGLLPQEFWNLWPIILIVVGLGGLVVCDRDEWMWESKSRKSAAPAKKSKSRRR